MRFVCQHCDSKYTIADDKVRNKVLKIRCKTCGNVIEVRDPDLATSKAPTPATERPPAPTTNGSVLEGKFKASFRVPSVVAGEPQGTPGLFEAVKRSAQVISKKDSDLTHWFIALDNSPVGPISARKAHAHRKSNRVTDDTLVWKEGMPDWVPLRNCKELVGLLARIDIEDLEASAGAAPREPRRGLLTQEPSENIESPLKGAGMGRMSDAAEDPGSLEGDTDDVEPTRMAKSSSIFEEIDKSFFAPKTGKGPNGVVDAHATADKRRLDDSLVDIWSDVSELRSLTPPRTQNRLVLYAAVGMFVIALTVLGIVLFSGVETVENHMGPQFVEKVVYRDRVVEKPVIRFVDRSLDEADTTTDRKARTKAKDTAADNKKAMDEKTRALMAQMGAGGLGQERGPLGSYGNRDTRGSGGRAAVSTLSDVQVKKVVTDNTASLKACYERALKLGQAPTDREIKVTFNLTVGSSGMVKSANLAGEGASAEFNSCLSRSVKKWVFPASAGDSPVEFPFRFTPR